jgi:plasmid maintenance system killer protein
MRVYHDNSKIRKAMNPAGLEARYGVIGARKLGILVERFISATSMKDIAIMPQYRLHWLKGDLAEFMAMDLEHPYRLLARKINGSHDDWSSITQIALCKITDYH